MDTAYLHLITNHIPIIGVPFAFFILVLGVWRKSDELKTASFLTFVFLGFATLGVFLLGKGGESFVEHAAGVSENAIDAHQDFALFPLITVGILALLSAFALLRYRGYKLLRFNSATDKRLLSGLVSEVSLSNFPAWIVLSILFLALLSGGLLAYTGRLGGKIRHTEFQNATQPTQKESGGENESEED